MFRNGSRKKLSERSTRIGFAAWALAAIGLLTSITAPAENSYAYMLEGFDENWVELGTRDQVTYTNLDTGDYLFRLRAANSDSVWNDDALNIAMRVEPAPWYSWWVYAIHVALAVLIIATIWRLQHRKRVREIEYSRRLETEVRERTEELAHRNNELSVLNDKLMEASLTDPLTGLRNRRFVFEQVAKDVDLVQRQHFGTRHGVEKEDVVDLVFMMVDLDHFKPINDEHGHAAGDQMLLQVRDVLLSACRSSDFVIRWGGDEFLVIARHTNAQEAEVLAERIRSRLAQKIFPLGDSHVGRTSVSIGFVCFPLLHEQPDVVPWDEALNLADAAMYRAKERRNAWCGYIGPDAAPSATVLKNALRTSPAALAEDGILVVRESKPQSPIAQTA